MRTEPIKYGDANMDDKTNLEASGEVGRAAPISDARGTRSPIAFFRDHPVLGFIGTIASIISVPLTIYFSLLGQRSRRLDFYLNPTTTTIVKNGESSDLHVLYGDKLITTDVTGLQIAVWNSGREAIHSQDVLDPVVIKSSVPILEARIT